MGVGDMLKRALLCSAFIMNTGYLAAQGTAYWEYSYREAQNAGQITSCNAYISFTNALFSARLYGEYMDFAYTRDDFTLPYDQVLGTSSSESTEVPLF
jgi:hypothetical protein